MGGQRFVADPATRIVYSNGAIGYGPGGPLACLGPYARVENCPVIGTALRLTCYATAYPDTSTTIPACTRYRGKHITGFFTWYSDSGFVFVPIRTVRNAERLAVALIGVRLGAKPFGDEGQSREWPNRESESRRAQDAKGAKGAKGEVQP